MAPNGNTSSGKKVARKSRDTQPSSWLEKHGRDEYDAWKEANTDADLSYDGWKQEGQNFNGFALYYTTLRILEESDSSVRQNYDTSSIQCLLTTPGRKCSAGQSQNPTY